MKKIYADRYYEIDLKSKEFEVLNKAVSIWDKNEQCKNFIKNFITCFRENKGINNLLGLVTIPEDEKTLIISFENLKPCNENKEIYFDEKELRHYVLV